ncbi:LamG domain-containing protein, partial [Vibrio harveyi]|uniref:LamG domain-containing protein n=1 Tax=Vibrio harveyi TaxID=669 RepID=UPI00209C5BB1
MTIMYWVNFNTLDSRYQLSGVHDDNNHRLYAGLDYGRPIAGVGNSTATGPDKVEVNQWVHLAAVFDKETRQRVLYLNGRELKRDSYVSFKGASLRSLLFGAAHQLEGASDFQDA